MIESKNMMHKAAAALLIIMGVAAMASAWFILLTTATHSVKIVGLEIGGVVVALAGYFLWKYSNSAGRDLAIKE